MKNPRSALYYPIVVKRSHDYITFSVPDLNITLYENLPDNNKLGKDYVTKLGKKLADAWLKTQSIMKQKESARAHLPEASLIKNSVKMAERPLTPTKFAKYVGVSYRTIIRDCEKGLIHAERTTGGHYKIPHSEIGLYKEYLKNHIKHASEPWSNEAVKKLRIHRESESNKV
jgi:excisionase family DNA binding protein